MHWIPIPYWPLFCKMRETGNRLITLKSHYEFLTECNRYKLIARGFELPNRINLGDMELKGDIEQSLQYTSLANQGKVSNWLKKEIKVVTKNFQKGKQELIWGMGKWDGELAVARIKNDLGRVEFSLKRTKGNKIRFLLEVVMCYTPGHLCPGMCSTSLLHNLMETILWKFWYGPRLLYHYMEYGSNPLVECMVLMNDWGWSEAPGIERKPAFRD